MAWLTSLGADCCGGCLESCSIFLLDSRNLGQSCVRWSARCCGMQYGGQNVYGSHPRLCP
jgi:hypothetical protein